MKFIKLFEDYNNHLTYDEIELDIFTKRYIVGRWFYNETEALTYLKSVIKYSEKEINDFYIYPDGNTYRIYPNPSEKDLKTKKASEYIKKHGIISSPDLKYISHPLYSYFAYKHLSIIKELGVKYKFEPIKNINLDGVIQRIFKKNDFGSVLIQNNILTFYSLPDQMDITYIRRLKNDTNNLLNKINGWLGTYYYVENTYAKLTDDSMKINLTNKLSGTEDKSEKYYKQVSFKLNRNLKKEDEYLIVVPMLDLNKPYMI